MGDDGILLVRLFYVQRNHLSRYLFGGNDIYLYIQCEL